MTPCPPTHVSPPQELEVDWSWKVNCVHLPLESTIDLPTIAYHSVVVLLASIQQLFEWSLAEQIRGRFPLSINLGLQVKREESRRPPHRSRRSTFQWMRLPISPQGRRDPWFLRLHYHLIQYQRRWLPLSFESRSLHYPRSSLTPLQ